MAPKPEEWRNHLPIGVWIASEDVQHRILGNTMATQQANPGIGTHWSRILDHTEQGLRTNHLNYSFWANAQPYSWQFAQNILGTVDTNPSGPMHKVYSNIDGRVTEATSPPSDLTNLWFNLTAGEQTYAKALEVAQPLVNEYSPHPSFLGYKFGDDITVGNKGQACITLMRAVQDLDPYGRPAVFPTADTGVYALSGADEMKIGMFSRYPIGKTTGGALALEGDFHRNTYSAVPNLGGGGGDWVDELRRLVNPLPESCKGFWFAVLQNHATVDAGASLRYPTAYEMRKQMWVAIGEGAKGLWIFTYDGSTDQDSGLTGNSWGIGDIHELEKLQAVGGVSWRLNPEIRRILLKSNPIYDGAGARVDLFTTSGGGSTGLPVNYPNAYKSTLQHEDGTYYVVVCNHNNSLTPQSVTISSATLTGKLISLESGEEYRLPATVSLNKLDGTIFRYDPDYGVPYWEPDFSLGTTENWNRHWANPLGADYRAPATIKPHPAVVDVVSGTNLQTLINAGPNETTYRLAASGVYEGTNVIVGKQHIHIIADDPDNKPIIRRLEIFGHAIALDYDKTGGINIVVGTPSDPNYEVALEAFYNPARDFLVRDIAFTADATPWLYYTWEWDAGKGKWIHNHRAYNMPIWIRSIRDMLVEGCTFTGYRNGADAPMPVGEFGVLQPAGPGISQYHGGLVSGNAGMVNICFRNNTCTAPGTAPEDRYPLMFFVDGGRGCAVVGNRAINRFNGGVLFLGNDDFTGNFRGDNDGGVGLHENEEVRTARYCYAVDNEFDQSGIIVAATGRNIGVYNNVHHGTTSNYVLIAGRCSRVWPLGHRYVHYDSVIDGNHSDGIVTAFVEVAVNDAGGCSRDLNLDGVPDTEPDNSPIRGLVGKTTVTNNTCGGAVTAWLRRATIPAPTITMDGPDVVLNNTDVNGTRDGI